MSDQFKTYECLCRICRKFIKFVDVNVKILEQMGVHRYFFRAMDYCDECLVKIGQKPRETIVVENNDPTGAPDDLDFDK